MSCSEPIVAIALLSVIVLRSTVWENCVAYVALVLGALLLYCGNRKISSLRLVSRKASCFVFTIFLCDAPFGRVRVLWTDGFWLL
jgi:archaellum biogenesis protein FlaJ (TadC family)